MSPIQNTFLEAFVDEFDKIAYDLQDARKSNKAMQQGGSHIRSRLPVMRHKVFNNPGPMTVTPTTPKAFQQRATAVGGIQPDKSELKAATTQISNWTRGKPRVFAKGSIVEPVNKMFGTGVKTPADKEMFNRAFLSHEQSEIKHRNKVAPHFLERTQHNSPGVIVEESNMLASMPKKHKEVKKAFHKMRRSSSGSNEAPGMERLVRGTGGKPGFVYGKRYSRHAKKHIANIVEKKLTEERKYHAAKRKKGKFARMFDKQPESLKRTGHANLRSKVGERVGKLSTRLKSLLKRKRR